MARKLSDLRGSGQRDGTCDQNGNSLASGTLSDTLAIGNV